jgi:hypothetical protein
MTVLLLFFSKKDRAPPSGASDPWIKVGHGGSSGAACVSVCVREREREPNGWIGHARFSAGWMDWTRDFWRQCRTWLDQMIGSSRRAWRYETVQTSFQKANFEYYDYSVPVVDWFSDRCFRLFSPHIAEGI